MPRRHGQGGGKRMHEEEEDERERKAGRSRRERHGFPDLRVLMCERRARMASRVREARLVSVQARAILTVGGAARTVMSASARERGKKYEQIVLIFAVVMILEHDDGVGGADRSQKRD
jgi:hypothetical protein